MRSPLILIVGDFNIFSIDWEQLALWHDYFGAAANTRYARRRRGARKKIISEKNLIWDFSNKERIYTIKKNTGPRKYAGESK